MSHQIMVSDEAFAAIRHLATERSQSPAELIEAWAISQQEDPHTEPSHQTFDEFFSKLGMSPSEIKKAKDDANI